MDIAKLRDSLGWRAKRYVGELTKKVVYSRVLQSQATAFDRGSTAIFRTATREDLLELPNLNCGYKQDDVAFGLERMGAGDELTLGHVDGKLAFLSWTMFGQMDLDYRSYFPLGDRDAYSYKVFTQPEFRGRGLVRLHYARRSEDLAGRGYTRLICWVAAKNVVSIRAHQKAGFHAVAHFHELRVRGFAPRFIFGRTFKSKVGAVIRAD